ncbi:MAG TPA: type IV toxin-antitoxin system AbiEi family antitoxin domain-containing protein [Steroidobacteraceae bacterium]|nr:type IV toxin-antitoxin system AbiEi family antitoxin domain-containing protein [Steroidobacteraceae bacterium]
MKTTNENFSFKAVVAELPRGEPLGVDLLAKHGVTAYRASALARSGWLIHLARGVYMLPGDTLTRDGCLAFLSGRISGFHVGSKTALDWRGVRHNVGFREVLSLWGNDRVALPSWFTTRFPSRYQVTQLFDAHLKKNLGLQSLPNGRQEVLVSVPERAMLELFSDVGKNQSLEEARQLVEGLRSLRSNVLEELMAHVTRIKVIRLAESLSKEFDLPWADLAKRHSQRLGGGKRWVGVAKSGERLDLRRS